MIQGIEKFNKMEKMPNDKSIDHLNNDRSEKLNHDMDRNNGVSQFGNNQEFGLPPEMIS